MKTLSDYLERIRVSRDPGEDARAGAPRCQWDGCAGAGTHRAPVGRHREGEYFRFCIDHVRQYNKGYNYFSGLSDGEVARFQKEALTGHRPTWRMGVNGAAPAGVDYASLRGANANRRLRDPFDLFGTAHQPMQETPRARRVRALEARALDTLGLTAAASATEIKARYKQLVKRHHPDANGGERGSEERFRDVVQAYRLLKQSGFC